ncbi:unnamed protein product [Camellia sinensis]
MAKEIIHVKVKSWIEVASSPLLFPRKPSNSPKLETIREERAEECEDDIMICDVGLILALPCFCVFVERDLLLKIFRSIKYVIFWYES